MSDEQPRDEFRDECRRKCLEALRSLEAMAEAEGWTFRHGLSVRPTEGRVQVSFGPFPQAARPDGAAEVLRRLAYLLGLSAMERSFLHDAARTRATPASPEADWLGVLAFADWLEEQGRLPEAGAVRRLTPGPGDVLVMRRPDGEEARDASAAALQEIGRRFEEAGLPRPALLSLAPAWAIEALSPHQMAEHGWIRAEVLESYVSRCRRLLDENPPPAGEMGRIGTLVTDAVCDLVVRLKRENEELRDGLAAERERCAKIAEAASPWTGEGWAANVAGEIRRGG